MKTTPNSKVRGEERGASQGAPEPVARFEVHYTQFLNAAAQIVQPLPAFAREPENLIPLYRAMVRTRLFDQKAVVLQRTGKLGTYASSLGQEAIGAAVGTAMAPEDVLLPAYREYCAQFIRGVTMTEILLYWGGNEEGMNFKGPRRDFPLCIPIATHAPHAVGVGYAIKLRKQARAVVCVLGDGATSKGDFYEAINAAGVFQVPVVFVVNNNQWAISQPRARQSHAKTLAQKAIAAGFQGEQVDGNDVIALLERIGRALEKARSGGGPSLIEALTYRLCDHTTADDASRYRSAEELQRYREIEPLIRLRRHLTASGVWSDAQEAELTESLSAEVEKAVQMFLATPVQPVESMFDHLYGELPPALDPQREEAIARSRSHG